jgi:hypothetical protein
VSDPLHDALRDATLAVLLGATDVPVFAVDPNGGNQPIPNGTITIGSAFNSRIQERARKGEFDSLIDQAIATITPEDLAETLKGVIAQQMLKGLENVTGAYGSKPTPGWLQTNVKAIAVEATTKALSADEALMETLRERIGFQVDRNKVGINVTLSDPES